MEYKCSKCDMVVTGLQCGTCQCDLVNDNIEVDSKTIQVSKCPKCEGMIKSPQCCGEDMQT